MGRKRNKAAPVKKESAAAVAEKETKELKKENKAEKTSEKTENIIALVVVLVVIIVFVGFWNGWWGLFGSTEQQGGVVTVVGAQPEKGDANAPITIVEYSDFQCPFCGKWFREVYPSIKETYIDTGRAKIIFKQFPLASLHANAVGAAMASECAFDQGNGFFWDYHDLLFQNQNALSNDDLENYAKQIGLNTKDFNTCLSNRASEYEVNQDLKDGQNAGIRGTPAFIIGKSGYSIDGELIVGAHPFTEFEEVISKFE